jgi:predicted secreted protein
MKHAALIRAHIETLRAGGERAQIVAKGRAFLLKVGDGRQPERFSTVAGLRVEREELQPGSISLTGSGVFTGSAAERKIKSTAVSGQLDHYQLQFEDGVCITGSFQITKFEYAGDFNGERTYRLTIEQAISAGAHKPQIIPDNTGEYTGPGDYPERWVGEG